MKAELLGQIMETAFGKNGGVSCKREFHGSAKGFTFRSSDGRYPVAGNGKIQWMENKAECLQMADMANASHLVVIGTDGKVADEIELVPNDAGQPPLRKPNG